MYGPYFGPSGVLFQTRVKMTVSPPSEQQRNVNLNIVDGPYCLKHGNSGKPGNGNVDLKLSMQFAEEGMYYF